MNTALRTAAIVAALLALMTVSGVFYVVQETEQVIITQLGKPVGNPITAAGLKLKAPFIQQVNRIEKRILPWDGPSAEMPTRDKLYIIVDAFGRWRISDPLQFYLRLRDERSAQSRLDDILGSEMRNTIARHDLVEVVRTTKGRKPTPDATLGASLPVSNLPNIQLGRVALEDEIYEAAKVKLAEFGIELLDVRFKRINYNPAVASKIYDRMISERTQIADRFRSEGAGEAAKIIGEKERDLRMIESEAYRESQKLMGKADAEATAIYAAAFNQSVQAREFYSFLRTLEVYKTSLAKETTVVLTTDSSLLRFLKGTEMPANAANTPPPATPSVPPVPPVPKPSATDPAATPSPPTPAAVEP
jgi:membrane protease subunit HflC